MVDSSEERTYLSCLGDELRCDPFMMCEVIAMSHVTEEARSQDKHMRWQD